MTAKREIAANVDRLNAYMDRNDLAARVIRSGKNFTYLAGFACPGTLSRHLDHTDSPGEVLLVWPRSGEPILEQCAKAHTIVGASKSEPLAGSTGKDQQARGHPPARR
jgi:Xaa-Pro aminopeptidase